MGAAVGWLIGFWTAVILAAFFTTPNVAWKQEAISRGYALYCPNNGSFAWKGECEND